MKNPDATTLLRRMYYRNVGNEQVLTARGTPRKNTIGMDRHERQRKNWRAMRDRFYERGLNSKGKPSRHRTN